MSLLLWSSKSLQQQQQQEKEEEEEEEEDMTSSMIQRDGVFAKMDRMLEGRNSVYRDSLLSTSRCGINLS